MRKILWLALFAAFAFGLAAVASAAVDQYSNTHVTGPVGPNGVVMPLATDTAPRVATVGPAEVCAVHTAGGTTLTIPAGTKRVRVCNGGPKDVYYTMDGTAPVAGTTGFRLIARDTYAPDDCAWIPKAANTVVKVIAAEATQLTGGCLQVATYK